MLDLRRNGANMRGAPDSYRAPVFHTHDPQCTFDSPPINSLPARIRLALMTAWARNRARSCDGLSGIFQFQGKNRSLMRGDDA